MKFGQKVTVGVLSVSACLTGVIYLLGMTGAESSEAAAPPAAPIVSTAAPVVNPAFMNLTLLGRFPDFDEYIDADSLETIDEYDYKVTTVRIFHRVRHGYGDWKLYDQQVERVRVECLADHAGGAIAVEHATMFLNGKQVADFPTDGALFSVQNGSSGAAPRDLLCN